MIQNGRKKERKKKMLCCPLASLSHHGSFGRVCCEVDFSIQLCLLACTNGPGQYILQDAVNSGLI